MRSSARCMVGHRTARLLLQLSLMIPQRYRTQFARRAAWAFIAMVALMLLLLIVLRPMS